MSVQRIALVSPYALSVFGGVQEQVLALSRELGRRGLDVIIVAPDGGDHGPHDTPANVATFGRLLALPANGSRAPVTLSPWATNLALRAVNEFAPDVVHLHEPFAPLLGYGALCQHAHPTVATFHRAGGGPAYEWTRPLLRRLARRIDVATAVSPAAAATIAHGAGVAARVLFNGFETERFREFDRRSPSEGELPTVLFVGRLEERKGAATLLEAAAREPGKWRLVVVGEGPQRRELQERARALTHVSFEGAVDDRTKRQWLRRADVVVAASTRGESFGLVILEAMASGTPVVVADIDGYREAAGGCGTLFAPGDPDALARAIARALTATTPDDIDRATAHAERWSMSSLVDNYLDLYREARESFRDAR